MTDKTLSEILEWLYVNDREFDSDKEWKEAFVKMLESKKKPNEIITENRCPQNPMPKLDANLNHFIKINKL